MNKISLKISLYRFYRYKHILSQVFSSIFVKSHICLQANSLFWKRKIRSLIKSGKNFKKSFKLKILL
jgi:hypothetical protein